jgi:nucleotide-binding universal stress UspA family protein
MFNTSAAAERALLEAASIADEHGAQLTVITSVPHERRMMCCAVCTVLRGYWNTTMAGAAAAATAELSGAAAEIRQATFAVERPSCPAGSGALKAADDETCTSTTTIVRSGRVRVLDLERKRTRVVSAGERYVATRTG